MSEIRSELKYLPSHEWARIEDDGTVTVGISDHAQAALGDVVFVELPEVNSAISAGDEISIVESVKTASDIHAPVSGEVLAVNEALKDTPELINSSPYDKGWILKIQMTDTGELEELLSASEYTESYSA